MDENILSFRANFHPEESLKRVQKEPTQENERRFFSEIKNARFLVPCAPKSGQSDDRRYPAILSTQKGEKFLPAFSDLAEFEKWPFSRGMVCVFSFDDLKHAMLEHPQDLAGIAINPFGKVRGSGSQEGLMPGRESGRFVPLPLGNATRAEAAVVLYRLMQKLLQLEK